MQHEALKPEDAEANRQVSDEELVVDFQAGNDAAFNELFNRYNLRLCNYLTNLVGNAETGRDLAQEAFIKACNQLPRGINKFKAWLYRVGYNSAMDHCRHKSKRQLISLESCSEDIRSIEGPEDSVERTELITIALGNIQKKYRAPIYLYYVEEWKQAEIASCLEISVRTVRRDIAEGVKELRSAYEHLVNNSAIARRGGSSRG